MVPSFFVPLARMPLNPNGKVDRKALPEPDIGEKAEAYAAPGSAVEMLLVELWSDVLGLEKEKIGIDADFFELGGDSLKSFFVTAKIKKALEVELSIPEFFSSPTIRGAASFIVDKAPEKQHLFNRLVDMAAFPGGALPDSDPAAFQEQVEAFIQQPLILFNPPTQHTQKNIFCFPPVLAFGLAYKVLASAIPDAAFYCFNFIEDEDRIRKYLELITTYQPVGPYILLGFSAAGKLTFETAAALESRGLEVSEIILIDSFWPGEDIAGEPQADTFQEIEDYLEELGVSFLKEKILSKVKNYWGYFSKKTPIGSVNARLHLIVSEERRESPLPGSWNPYTAQPPVVYQGFGRHADMIYAAGADKNAEIIRSVVKS
jgi:thioesterase domain-containing protein/acyl carrier protein